jgi:hypothetical protein
MDKFSVQLPLTGEYLTTVRLTVGGLCALADFDVDSAEDFKVCVTESLLILKRGGFTRAAIEFTVGETLSCALTGLEKGDEIEDETEDEISYALLGALVGNAVFAKNDGGRVEKISFEG